jgi:DUF438 domain-containing protein
MQKQKVAPVMLYSEREIKTRSIIRREIEKFCMENNILDPRTISENREKHDQLFNIIIEAARYNGIDSPIHLIHKYFEEEIM